MSSARPEQSAGPGLSPQAQERLRRLGAHEWMIQALADEARLLERTLDGHLVEVGPARELPDTAVTARCHFVARDGNGNPLVAKLTRKLANQVVDYCIPRSRVDEARAAGSTEGLMTLQHEAVELFVKADMSGEAGELLLYLLLEVVLELPQLLCKMPLKTNTQVHVHGTDGIHGEMLPDGRLALYWGEAKLHADATRAIDACFESLVPFLLDDGSGRASRDLQLLRSGLDLRDKALEEGLHRYLLDDTVESTRVSFRGVGLIGFDLAGYPDPHEDDGLTVRAEIEDTIAKWHARIAKAVGTHNVEKVVIELFCVPVPSVADLRTEMQRALRLS